MVLVITMMFGCIPYSEHPLTDPDKEQTDASIIGTWFWVNENELGYIHIGRDKESKWLRLIMVDVGRDGELETSEFFGHTSSLEGNTYLNLKWVRPAEAEMAGYTFVKYVVNQESLGIAMMGGEEVEEAIKSGLLEGELEKGDWFSSVRITEGQKKLQQFILQNDKKLFPEMKYLTRLKLPN